MNDEARIELIGVAEKAAVLDASGDLLIEGWAAKYDEPDRQMEYFMPGAFAQTWDNFKKLGAPLLFQHDSKLQIGQVEELTEKAEGVWMKARMPKPNSPQLLDVWENVKRGFTKGLSSKGMFTKQLLPTGGARVRDVDLYEISVTPVAVGASATIETVAQKAFPDLGDPSPEEIAEVLDGYFASKISEARDALDAIDAALEGRS